MKNNKGIVYVLTNPAMPGLVKIGMTNRDNIELRMKELYSTGVPVPFDCAYACEVSSSDCLKIEQALHKAFAPNRINQNREFFKMEIWQATAILDLFNKKEITSEIAAEIDNDLTAEDKKAGEQIKIARRPPLNYQEMGVAVNSILSFVKDPDITVVVISDKKVNYNGEIVSLTAVTRQLLNSPRDVAPTKYWVYEGKNLRDIYDEIYSLEL